MKKRVGSALAIFLATVLLFSGCSGGKGKSQSSSSSGPVTVKVAFMSLYGNPKDQTQVEDAINKITVDKANVKISLMPISGAQWQQQMNLIMAGNEQLDLTVVANQYSTFVSQNKLLPLDDLLSKYGQGITKAFDDVNKNALKDVKVNGKIYAIPTVRIYGQAYGIDMRQDIADAVGVKNGATMTLDQAETMLKAVKEKYPNMTPIMPQTCASPSSMVQFLLSWDTLGDGFGVLMNKGQDTPLKVQDLYETSEYSSLVNTMHKWYDEGLIAKDSATTADTAATRIKAGSVAGMVANMKPYFYIQEQALTGKPMVDITINSAFGGTSYLTTFMFGLPANNCKNPEAAMKMLNLMYSNKDVANLLAWGLEGTDYAKTSTANQITYPSGGASSVQWCQGLDWMMGNESITYAITPWPADLRQQTDINGNKNMLTSKATGFNWDSTSMKNQITAVTNVRNQYAPSLEDGAANPSTVLPQFIAALKAAGIEQIVKTKQDQLNTWLKANGHSNWVPAQ